MNTSSILDLDSPYIKSYATEANLAKAMQAAEITKVRHLVVRTPRGRWTALVLGFQQHLLGSGWAMVS